MNVFLFRLGAVLCFLAVALGAFGAHALKAKLQLSDLTSVWEKAVLYHFLHAVALLALSVVPNLSRTAPLLLVAGIAIFSGSLYIMALTNLRWLGAITPLGGCASLPAGSGWRLLRGKAHVILSGFGERGRLARCVTCLAGHSFAPRASVGCECRSKGPTSFSRGAKNSGRGARAPRKAFAAARESSSARQKARSCRSRCFHETLAAMKLLLLFALLLMPVTLFADGGLPNQPYIYVEGKAEIQKPADMVTLRFDVVARNADQAKANAEVQGKAGKILGLANDRKIAQTDVIATDLKSQPQYEGEEEDSSRKRGKLIGYSVTRSFLIKVRDVTVFAKLVDELSRLAETNSPVSMPAGRRNADGRRSPGQGAEECPRTSGENAQQRRDEDRRNLCFVSRGLSRNLPEDFGAGSNRRLRYN